MSQESVVSFTSEIKDELCHLEIRTKCCAECELEAITSYGKLSLRHEQGFIDDRIFYLNKKLSSTKANNYCKEFKSGKCCSRAYLRGAFIIAGNISDPKKAAHLDISFRDSYQANLCLILINNYNLNVKSGKRKNHYIVYIKDANGISDFLNIIGAHKGLLKYENERVIKELRNTVNRQVNCENANMQKIVDVSFRQTQAISFIREAGRFEFLPENLRKVAILREDNPEISLTEIGLLLEPHLSKAGVSHRLKVIEIFANEIKK